MIEGRKITHSASIRRTLQLWLLLGATLCTVITGWMTYRIMRDEANELFDRQLRQLVVTIPHDFSSTKLTVADSEPEDDIVVQVWDESGKLRYAIPKGESLPKSPGQGYAEITYKKRRWRVYSKIHKRQYIQAAQPIETRNELAGQMALGATAPFLLLIPALLVLIWFVIRRGLRPLHQVTQAVSQRSMDSLMPISAENTPVEILPLLDALNDLLSRLEKAWATQRTFIAEAAHELRSPLTALKLQLQRAEKTRDVNQRAIAFGKLHERLDRATHVVQQLLTLARQEPQAGHLDNNELTDIVGTATACIAQFGPLAEAKHIDLGLESNVNAVLVNLPATSLRILLDNLVDNAIRYTPESGCVIVGIENLAGKTRLSVSDTGPGISSEDRERVFDRFYRGESNGEMGSGLGLAIVKTITEHYHATILLGDNVHGGTRIDVEFSAVK